jgi:hypothetical protein
MHNSNVESNVQKLAIWSHGNGRVGETSWRGCDLRDSLIDLFILSISQNPSCAIIYDFLDYWEQIKKFPLLIFLLLIKFQSLANFSSSQRSEKAKSISLYSTILKHEKTVLTSFTRVAKLVEVVFLQ